MKQTKIEWADATWNVSTGCTQISPACNNCYAKAMTKRLQGMAKAQMDKRGYKCDECGFDFVEFDECLGDDVRFDDIRKHNEVCCAGDTGELEPHKAFTLPKYSFGFDKVIFHPSALDEIKDKKKYPSGKKVFVNSMSDLFHEDSHEFNFVDTFAVMSERKDLIFQVLTKRAEIMFKFFKAYGDGFLVDGRLSNIWLGVTAENQAMADERIPYLLKVKELLGGKVITFVSVEPMLEQISIGKYLKNNAFYPCHFGSLGLDWVICGGEKIPNNARKARELNAKWVESLYTQCIVSNIPFFFKQWGSNPNFREVNHLSSIWDTIENCKQFPKEMKWN